MPCNYYVNAQARLKLGGFGGGRGGAGRGGPAGAAVAGAIGRIAGPNVAALFRPDDDDQKSYAPTYYPGVSAMNEAKPVTVGLSEESLNNDFNLQLVHVARVAGHVSYPDGSAATSGNVALLLDG